MELALQSLFGLHVQSCTHWLRPCNPLPSSRIWTRIRGRYWSAKIDDIHLFVTPCLGSSAYLISPPEIRILTANWQLVNEMALYVTAKDSHLSGDLTRWGRAKFDENLCASPFN
jgi:hypothetical protein